MIDYKNFLILESILEASPEFLDIIKSLREDPIAISLGKLINKDIKTNFNYLTIGDNNDIVGFQNDNQYQRNTSNKTPKSFIKVGRLVNQILSSNNIKFSDREIETFINKYKSFWDGKFSKTDNIFLVSGESIRYWYSYRNYNQGGGQLNSSCMRYDNCQDFLDIFVQNPEVCQLLVLIDDDRKLLGRAIFWSTKGNFSYYTGAMYSSIGSIPIQINTPKFKDFMIKIVNNDEVSFDLDENLKILITSDLSFRQSLDIVISGTDISSQNKKLDIYLTTTNPLDGQIPNDETVEGEIISGTPVETLIIGDIDLPIFYNLQTSQQNSAKSWSNFQFGIDFNQDIIILPDNNLQLNLDGNQYIVSNSIKEGDYLVINNLFVGTTSVFDFSGQYMVSDVGTGSQITLDTNINEDLVSYATGQLPMTIHGASSSLLSNVPFLSINKGQWIRITRTNELDQIPINEKYLIDIRNIDY